MPAGSTYTPIATTTLGSNATSYTFSSIAGTYTDLRVIFNGTMTAPDDIGIRFNSDTGSNYSTTILGGNGTTAFSTRVSNQTQGYLDWAGLTTAYGNFLVDVQNYSNSTTYKTYLSRFNQAARGTDACVGLWRSTSAITSITLKAIGANSFSSGSIFTLYGIAAA